MLHGSQKSYHKPRIGAKPRVFAPRSDPSLFSAREAKEHDTGTERYEAEPRSTTRATPASGARPESDNHERVASSRSLAEREKRERERFPGAGPSRARGELGYS